MTVAAIGALPGNFLNLQNQSFQNGIGSWTTSTGAASLGTSSTEVFEGVAAARWSASAATSSVISGTYPVVAGLPYIASGYLYLASAGTVTADIAWSTGASASGAVLSVPAGWNPVVVSGIAPSGATSAHLVATVGSQSGAFLYMGLVYFAQSEVQVLADWDNPAFSAASIAGNAFADLTPFVQAQEATINMTHGRQDAIGEVQNGTLQFQCDNFQGWFTPQNTNSPWLPSIGARVQVNVSYATASGTASTSFSAFRTRFDGSINEFDFEIDAVAGHPQVQINARDVIGSLSNQDGLACWTKEQILLDGPIRHWTLDDASGLTQAQESSGYGGAPLTQRTFGTTCTGSFGGGNSGVETQADTVSIGGSKTPGPFSSSTLGSYYVANSSHSTSGVDSGGSAPLVGPMPWLYLNGNTFDPVSGTSTNAGWSFEIVATPDATAGSTSWLPANTFRLQIASLQSAYWAALSLWAVAQSTSISAELTVGPPTGATSVWSSPNTVTDAWNSTNPQPIHLVWTCTTGSVLTLYIDGATATSTTISASYRVLAFDQLVLGDHGGSGTISGWSGNLSLASIYNYVLTPTQVAFHNQVLNQGFAQQLSGNVIQYLAKYANMPSFWVDANMSAHGLTYLDYFDITGSNPLAAMQAAEGAEAGLLYADQAGVLRFAGRDVRMGAGSSTLALPEGSFDAQLTHKVTDQYVQTSAAVAGTAFGNTLTTRIVLTPASSTAVAPTTVNGLAAVSFNNAALLQLGQYPNGDATSPTTVPVPTVAQALPNPGTAQPYAQDIADWNVNRNAQPPFKATTLTIDVLTMTYPSSPTWIAPAVIASQDISSVLTVTVTSSSPSFPNGAGDLDLFVEGVTETIGVSVHTIQFYTSPANSLRCWVPGDPFLGILDSTAVIGISSESAKPSILANNPSDPGGPWLAPAYSTSMNQNQGASGYVGASDQRGIWQSLKTMFSPPLFVGWATSVPTITTGSFMRVPLAYTLLDNYAGFNSSVPVNSTQSGSGYVCQLGGFYEINASAVISTTMAAGSRGLLRALVYDPRLGLTFVVATSESPVARSDAAWTPMIRSRFFMGPGAIVSLWFYSNNSGGAVTLGNTLMSLEFAGFSYTAD